MVAEVSLRPQEHAQSICPFPLPVEARASSQGHICRVEDKNTRREFVDRILRHQGSVSL